MKIVCLLFVFQSLLTVAYSQSVKVNETDKVTGQQKIETDYASIVSDYPIYLGIRYRSAGASCFIEFRGSDIGVGIIEPRDGLIIQLEDSSRVTIYPTSKQDFTLDDNHRYYSHVYTIKKDQITKLSRQKSISIRKYSNERFEDIAIPEKNRNAIMNLSAFFLKNIH